MRSSLRAEHPAALESYKRAALDLMRSYEHLARLAVRLADGGEAAVEAAAGADHVEAWERRARRNGFILCLQHYINAFCDGAWEFVKDLEFNVWACPVWEF